MPLSNIDSTTSIQTASPASGRTWLHVALLLALGALLSGPAHAQWNWQSPHPQGNTLLRVDFVDSTNGWAVGEYGTAIHTTDGGLSWYEQEYARTDNLLGIDMVSDSTGWATGDNGVILHTTNGGDDWLEQVSPVNSGLNAITFIDSLRGWAGGDNEVVLRTTNGGTTWTVQHQSFSPPVGINAITFRDSVNGWAVGSNRSVFHTTNGGTNWLKQTVGATASNYLSVHFVNATLGFIVGSGGVLLRTDDGGTVWTSIATGVTGNLNQVVMQNTFVGWAGGDAGLLLKTINGGLTWSQSAVGEGENLNGLSRVGGKLWAVGEFGAIFLSTNSGVSWARLDAGTRLSANWVDFPSDSVGVAVGQAGLILRTTDGGANWTELPSPAPTASTYGVHCVDGLHAWAVGDNGTILRTIDGVTWGVQSSPVTHALFGVTFGDLLHGWIVGGEYSTFKGVILRTTDGGNSWGVQNPATANILYGVSFPTATTGWAVGENGLILHTTNGGATWTPQTSGVSNALFWCSFADVQNGWAVGEQGRILHTSNGGAVWSTQSSGVGVTLFSVVERGTAEAFAVGDNGVLLHTTDTGINWDQEYTRTQYSLYGISRSADSLVWIAGDYGTLLANGVPRGSGGAVTGRVFNDANNNGQLDFGESGMQGWLVRLSGGALPESTLSDPTGLFRFTNLPGGDYTLEEVTNPGWTRTLPVVSPHAFSLTVTDPNYTSDFGNFAPNSYGYPLTARWNLVSLSLAVTNPATTLLYAGAISPAYAFTDMYNVSDSLVPGPGYWIKFSAAQTRWILGTPISAETLAIVPGWNLVGMIQDTVPVASIVTDPPGIITSPYFGYEGGYRTETKLTPGEGYWVLASDSGRLFLQAGAAAVAQTAAKAPERSGRGSIILRDADGDSQSLLVGIASGPPSLADRMPLPPVPPAGAFDARFETDAASALLTPGKPGEVIRIQSDGAPVSIAWTIPQGERYELREARTGAFIAVLRDSGAAALPDGVRSVRLGALASGQGPDLPHEFSLLQNWPNPFNPSTSIRFTLPGASAVRLTVYSILGQEVARLIDGELDGGEHTARWTAAGASGLYFYRLEAVAVDGSGRHFHATRKMMVLK